MAESRAYLVCDSCACALVNADTSAMDGYELAQFENFCSDAGLLAEAEQVPMNGNWNCDCCAEVVYDAHGHLFERV